MCCIHWRDALVTGKSHPDWGFVDVLQTRKPTLPLQYQSDVVGIWALCCQDSWRLPKFRAPISLVSMRIISVALHFHLGSANPGFFRVCNSLAETSFWPGYWCLLIVYLLSVFSIYSTFLIFEFLGEQVQTLLSDAFSFFVTQNKFDFKVLVAACTESRLVLGGF